MTPLLVLLTLIAIAFALAILFGDNDPPAPTAGQWINDYVHQEALREAKLRRLQRF